MLYLVEVEARGQSSRRHGSGRAAFRTTFHDPRIAPGLVVGPCERPLRLTSDEVAIPSGLTPPDPR